MQYEVTIHLLKRSVVRVEAPSQAVAVIQAFKICEDDDHIDVDLDIDYIRDVIFVEELGS